MRFYFAFLFVGCASAQSASTGEYGLADLRVALGLSPAVGHVERVGGEARLVHDATGVVLATVPTPSADAPCAKRLDLNALVFEGDPGAALSFDLRAVTAWQRHPAQYCPVMSEAIAIREPAWAPLVTLDSTGPGEAHAAVPHETGAEPVTVVLEPGGAQISRGAEAVVFDFPTSDRCSFTARAETFARTDGVTWLRVSYLVTQSFFDEECEDTVDDDAQATGYVWVEIARDGAPRVIGKSEQPALRSEDVGLHWHAFDIAHAVVEYEEVSHRRYFSREGPTVSSTWTWTLVASDERVILSEGKE